MNQSDPLLAGLVDTMPMGVFAEDIRRGRTYVNDRMLAYAGLTRDQVQGDGWFRLLSIADRSRLLALWGQGDSGQEEDVFDTSFEHYDGSQILLRLHLRPRFDDDGVFWGYVGTATDITPLQEMEHLHRDKLMQMQALVDNFPGVIFRVFCSAIRLEMLFVSNGIQDLTGFSRAEVLAASPDYLVRWVYPEDRSLLLAARDQLLERLPFRERIRVFRPDGGMYWVDLRIMVVSHTKGGAICEGMAVDVTQEMDARLRLQWQEQEHIRLQQQMQEARKLETLGRLAGGIAHDFNNLLGAILGFAQFVAEDVGPDHPAFRNAGLILDAADRGRGIVAQILAFARQTPSVRRRFRLEDLVRDSDALIRMAVPANIAIDVSVKPLGLMVEADRTKMGQILLNLCLNARDAVPPENGRIGIHAEIMGGRNPWIQLLSQRPPGTTELVDVWTEADGIVVGMVGTAQSDQTHVALLVEDNGTGMEVGQIAKVFDPFFTTKDIGKGTGLGLSVVHAIIMEHQGAVLIRSRPGAGTEIRVVLPALAAAADDAQDQTVKSQEPSPGRVLVVDDDPNFGKMLAQLMTRKRWDVTYFRDPLDAVAAVTNQPQHWDLVITDQVMPHLRGQELIQRLKVLNPLLPCILCTGYDATITLESAQAFGASTLLFKPLTAKQLLDAVAAVVPTVKS